MSVRSFQSKGPSASNSPDTLIDKEWALLAYVSMLEMEVQRFKWDILKGSIDYVNDDAVNRRISESVDRVAEAYAKLQ